MKLLSFALIRTSPFTAPDAADAAASSTAATISPSSSVVRRPSEFMLSPSRSTTAQAMPSKSTVIRQSCKSGSVVGMGGLLGGDVFGPAGAVLGRRRPAARKLAWREIVNGNDTGDKIAKFGKGARLARGEHAFRLGLGEPVVAVETLHLALADRALELLVGLLAGDGLGERIVEHPEAVARIVGDEDVAGETVAESPRLERSAYDRLAGRVARRAPPRAQGEHERRHRPCRPPDREIAQDAEQRLIEAIEAVPRTEIHDLEVFLRTAVVVIALEHGREQIEFGERVGHAAGDLLLHLEPAAEERDGRVGDEREGTRRTRKLAPPSFGVASILRRRGEQAESHIVE